MNIMNDGYEDSYDEICEFVPESKISLAMGYVPDQPWETPYDPMEGLKKGTLFPGLDKPWVGRR